jgi:NADPH-dependent 2,4-dienoyl-CoA reductase/sulfur reductase-like enzyme/nitrite reductase/ring-hydroxylating ferredoxin subunit
MSQKVATVAKTVDLKDGEMKKVEVDGHGILLSKIEGKIYAVGATCTHYGASLDEGALHGDRIVCPWHHACFNAKSGDLLEPPALDALPKFEVIIDGEDVKIMLPESPEEHRLPDMSKADSAADGRKFVIIGAGAAGNAAAQTLREDGFEGKIISISYENRLPYDRPNLSKDYLQGEADPEWMPLRSNDFYKEFGIDLWLGRRVIEARVRERVILFEDGEKLAYDTLLLAPGGTPRRLNVPGAELQNVFTLRSYSDCDRIIEASEGISKVAIIGASFIGMETAFSLRERGLPVTVIGLEDVPFENILGREIGQLFKTVHQENGVQFKLGQSVAEIQGDQKVEAVILENGERVEADLAIMGVGVIPAADFIREMDLETDGGVKVDRFFKAGDNLYAAGDIACFPEWRSGRGTRIEHWRTAEQHGRIAAHNMAGKNIAYDSVPFFWTTQAGLHFRYVGHAKEWDEIIVDGNIAEKDFIAYYIKNNQIWAAAGNNRDKEMAAIQELMRINNMPPPEDLRKGGVDLFAILKG